MLGDHPAFDVTQGGLGETLLLTDILFNEETTFAGTANIGGISFSTLDPNDVLIKYRDDFRKFFGDIEYNISNAAQLVAGNGLVGAIGKYKIKEPEISPQYTYLLAVHRKFNLLRHILGWYCMYQNDLQVQGSGTSDGAFYSFDQYAQQKVDYKIPWDTLSEPMPGTNPNNWYWKPPIQFKILDDLAYGRLSIPGFTWSPGVFASLYAEVRNLHRKDITVGSTTFSVLDCRELTLSTLGTEPFVTLHSPETGAYAAKYGDTIPGPAKVLIAPLPNNSNSTNYVGVEPTPIQDYIDLVIKPVYEGVIPRLYKLMYFYARRLALGETLGQAKAARDIILELSSSLGSSVPSTVVNQAMKLISKSIGIGVNEIENALQTNVEEMRSLSLLLFAQLQEQTQKTNSGN